MRTTKSAFIVRKRQPRGERRIADIIHVASESFAKHGFDGTSMNSIAQQTGMSIGSLYQYFPDKDAIVDAVAEEYVQAFRKTRVPLTTRKFATLHELASVAIENLVDFIRRHAGIKAFLDADPRRAPSIRNLQNEIDAAVPLLSQFYPTAARSELAPMITIASALVESIAPRIAAERKASKRAWFIEETANVLICYIEAKLGEPDPARPAACKVRVRRC
jgi:AcrR family transcriptional regulator